MEELFIRQGSKIRCDDMIGPWDCWLFWNYQSLWNIYETDKLLLLISRKTSWSHGYTVCCLFVSQSVITWLHSLLSVCVPVYCLCVSRLRLCLRKGPIHYSSEKYKIRRQLDNLYQSTVLIDILQITSLWRSQKTK
jgi:hypothetical protein